MAKKILMSASIFNGNLTYLKNQVRPFVEKKDLATSSNFFLKSDRFKNVLRHRLPLIRRKRIAKHSEIPIERAEESVEIF